MVCYCDGCAKCEPTHWTCHECNGTWKYGTESDIVKPHEIKFDIEDNYTTESVQYLLCENCYNDAPVDCCNCWNETTHKQLEDDDGCWECGLGVHSDGSGIQCDSCNRSYSDLCDWRNGYGKMGWFYGYEDPCAGEWIMLCPHCSCNEETMQHYDKMCDEIVKEEHWDKLMEVHTQFKQLTTAAMSIDIMQNWFQYIGNMKPNNPVNNVLKMLCPEVFGEAHRRVLSQMMRHMSAKGISCQA